MRRLGRPAHTLDPTYTQHNTTPLGLTYTNDLGASPPSLHLHNAHIHQILQELSPTFRRYSEEYRRDSGTPRAEAIHM